MAADPPTNSVKPYVAIGGYISFEPNLPDDLTFMTFLTNNRGHYSKVRFDTLKAKGVTPFPPKSLGRRFIHASYVTVLSSEGEETVAKSMVDVEIASEIANWLGFEGLIVHMPHCAHFSPRFVPNYRMALELCKPPCVLYLEHMTGCPAKDKFPLEILAEARDEIIKSLKSETTFVDKDKKAHKLSPDPAKKWGFCLDTCHLFAEGQPMTTEANAQQFITLEKQIPVGVIHLNGSVEGFLSHRDEHCRTGSSRDKIWGKDNSGLRVLVKHWIDENIPIILERGGYSDPKPYEGEIEDLLTLVGMR